MPNRPKRGSGERSNWYSGSKFTNWTPFDPYSSELRSARRDVRPSKTVERGPDQSPLPVFEAALHDDFIRPASGVEIAATLELVPAEFLTGLAGVFLLSGTRKQARALRLFRYGCYASGDIHLHAFPKALLHLNLKGDLKPSVEREYLRAGAKIRRGRGGSVLEFDPASLRAFYLYDVLLHEVGHHVDERVDSRPCRAAERFAEWFAEAQARELFVE